MFLNARASVSTSLFDSQPAADPFHFSSGIYCSTRSQYHASSWWQPCVTLSKRTHSSEVRWTVVYLTSSLLVFPSCCRRFPAAESSFGINILSFAVFRSYTNIIEYSHLCVKTHSVTAVLFLLTGKRPFGVSLLYMGWDKHYGFQLYQSDPSGNYGGWKATCIGNNSAVSLKSQSVRSSQQIHQAVSYRGFLRVLETLEFQCGVFGVWKALGFWMKCLKLLGILTACLS